MKKMLLREKTCGGKNGTFKKYAAAAAAGDKIQQYTTVI